MKKTILSIAATALLLGPAILHGQARLVEKVTQKGKELVIPYERYVLPNGLTLLIHEDHSDPLVHVDVTYHVGSAREEIGKSGFAHFFEHMMFQGSDNVADEQHFKVITEAGGTLNGTTNRDRTNYFETVPANQLEKMLWLEADRMGFLLDAVTQQKFEVQRATVKNERGQRYDNQPYGLVGEVTARNLYPYGHPYSWLTIGYIEDLNRVNAQDLKNFFLRWYGPNNAVLTVGGDVQPRQVIAWVEKYFGSIPKGPEVKPAAIPLPVLDKDRYVSMTDNYAKLPMLRMTYPVPPAFHKDQPALECLAEILGDGKSSLFYKNMIKTGKAVNASANNNDHGIELSGEFIVSVTPYPGQKLADMEKLVRETFAEFEKKGPSDEDIAKFRNSSEAGLIYGLESVAGKVSQLAAYYTFTGNPNYIGKELRAYTSVTKEDVMRVYNQYIKGKHAVILSVLTKGNESNKAGEDNYTVSQTGYKAPAYGYEKLKYNKAKDNFDRKQMPGATQAVVVKAPAFWQGAIDPSIKAIGAQTSEVPVVNLILRFKGGKMTDLADKNGTANLFATMMNEDTKNYSAEAFSQALEQLGSSIQVSAGDDEIVVQMRCLSRNLDKTMALLEERLLRPQFTEEDFSRNKKRLTESVKNMLNQPTYVATTVYNRLLTGPDNPLGRPTTGTEATIANITLEDIKNYYDNRFTRIGAEVVAVGDVTQQAILGKLAFLKQLSNVEVMPSMLPQAPAIEKTKVYFVHIPGAAQTEFRVGTASDMRYDATGPFYRSTVMNYPLGGAFNSRLNLYLREDKGWTYGARSNFNGDKYDGDYTFSAGIKAAATDSAFNDVLRILSEYKANGATAEELSFTQNSITQSEARKYETGIQKAGFLGNILSYDLPANYTEQQNTILKGLTVADMKSLAAQHLPAKDHLIVLLVGDKANFADQLKAKGYELVELDKEGKTIQ